MEDILYTVKETSLLLKTNVSYVYDLIKAGRIKALKLGALKIRKIEVENFLKEYEGKDLTNPFVVKNLFEE